MWLAHGIDLTTGAERAGFPVTITGSADNDPTQSFNSVQELQRPGLLLLNGVVYAAFGSNCDVAPYSGWIIGVSTAGALTARWTTEAGASKSNGGGIWMSGGGGLVSDGDGQILFGGDGERRVGRHERPSLLVTSRRRRWASPSCASTSRPTARWRRPTSSHRSIRPRSTCTTPISGPGRPSRCPGASGRLRTRRCSFTPGNKVTSTCSIERIWAAISPTRATPIACCSGSGPTAACGRSPAFGRATAAISTSPSSTGARGRPTDRAACRPINLERRATARRRCLSSRSRRRRSGTARAPSSSRPTG